MAPLKERYRPVDKGLTEDCSVLLIDLGRGGCQNKEYIYRRRLLTSLDFHLDVVVQDDEWH